MKENWLTRLRMYRSIALVSLILSLLAQSIQARPQPESVGKKLRLGDSVTVESLEYSRQSPSVLVAEESVIDAAVQSIAYDESQSSVERPREPRLELIYEDSELLDLQLPNHHRGELPFYPQRNISDVIVGQSPNGTARIFLADENDLEALFLKGVDNKSQAYVERLRKLLLHTLEKSSYWLFFEQPKFAPDKLAIYNQYGDILSQFLRVSRPSLSCASITTVDSQEILFGQGLGTATQGVCGQIATVHSLLALKVLNRAQAVKGDFLHPNPVNQAGQFAANAKQGMALKEVATAHADRGLKNCAIREVDTQKPNDLRDFNNRLADKMKARDSSGNPDYDCSLSMTTINAKGQAVLSHLEHVKGISLASSGAATIDTTNGFDQGNRSTTIPANPGQNTWESSPGGTPACQLKKGANAQITKNVGPIPVGFLGYVCCRR